MTMNGKKWAVAGVLSLAAMFGFAASYTPKIEVTGPLASVGSYGDDIQQIGLSAPDGRVVNFNVAALHLQKGHLSLKEQYKATADETLLATLWHRDHHPGVVFANSDYIATAFTAVP